MVRGWSHLERQKGGIGLRGPGETQLETDRRLIGKRISTLIRRLERIRRQRELRRRSRRKVPVPTISLVCYTNAGKSTLFNRLTEANAFVADQVFVTLYPTMRRIDIEGFGEAIISDTVGFIRDLPHGLVSAFHATLEEVSHADLLIHVVDATDPDRGEMMAAVNQVLDEIDANQIPTIMVYNKIDLGERDSDIEHGREGRIQKVWLSAVSGEGIPLLLQGIADHLGSDRRQFRLRLPVSASRLRASLYRRGSVVTEAFTDEGDSLLELNLDSGDIGWLEQQEELARLESEIISLDKESEQISIDSAELDLTISQQRDTRAFQILTFREKTEHLKALYAQQAQILAPVDGLIEQVRTRTGDVVQQGMPVAQIKKNTASFSAPMHCIVYVTLPKSKRIEIGQDVNVELTMALANRYGYMKGVVQEVAMLPSSEQDLMLDLANKSMTKYLLDQGPVLRVTVKLNKDADTASGFKWTTRYGYPSELTPGTTCVAHITVQSVTPISLLVPWVESMFYGQVPKQDEL